MKKILFTLLFVSIGWFLSYAQQSTNGATGTYNPGNPFTGGSLSSLVGSNMEAFVHEYNTDNNIVFQLPSFTNPVVVSNTFYINTGDFANDDYLYATGIYWDMNLYRIDVYNGTHTVIGQIPLSGINYSTGMAYNRNTSTMYLLIQDDMTSSYIFNLNLTNASISLLATFPSTSFYTLAFQESTNTFFTMNRYTNELVAINGTTWATTAIGTVGFSVNTFFCGADFNDVSGELYISHYDGVDARIYQVNPNNASSELINHTTNADFIVLALRNNITAVPVSLWIGIGVFMLLVIGVVLKKRFF